MQIDAVKRFFYYGSCWCLLAGMFPAPSSAQTSGRASPQRIVSFPLEDVTLLQGPLKDAQENDRNYLLRLDTDRLLRNFRVNAGLPSKAIPLGGWEAPDCELRGHFTGHYLSACALAFASTRDEALKRRATRLVKGLAECQKALGESGYLSAFPEEFFDRVETGRKVWAPWYTVHKIGAGLLDVHSYCGDKLALDVLLRMMAWAKHRTDRLNDAQMQAMLNVEHGGMAELLRNLYTVSGNPDHLALAKRFDHKAFLAPLEERHDALGGIHANTNILKVIGAARAYELSGDSSAYVAAMFFWNQIVHTRSYVTGGTSNYEYWLGSPSQLATQLSAESHENCCTYNMLRLTEHVFRWTGSPDVADYYERALFNGILPTQKPGDGSGIMYYVPTHAGLFKLFGDPDSAYWCCTGTGIESFAKLGKGIYYHDSAGVYVNLYVGSELQWKERRLTLKQETRFPDEEGSTITITSAPPTPVSIYLRIPSWVAPNSMSFTVNGATIRESPSPPGYATITRIWSAGDRIDIRLPMHLHLESLPDNHSLAAILYGPIVLAGELGTDGMTEAMRQGFSTPEVDRAVFEFPASQAPRMVIPTTDVTTWVEPVPGQPLTFRTVNAGKPRDVTLLPFFRLFRERYAIYWELEGEIDWEIFEPERNVLPPGVIDIVRVGDGRSDRIHNFQAFRCDTGSTAGREWVQSNDWFRYDLSVLPSKPQILTCQLVKERRECAFDLLLDGLTVRSDTVKGDTSGSLLQLNYPISPELVDGKHRVAIKFRARDNKPTARLSQCTVTTSPSE